jgi:hypothetical protein
VKKCATLIVEADETGELRPSTVFAGQARDLEKIAA